MIEIFKKEYDGESIVDIDRDISELMIADYNPNIGHIPTDKYGLHKGIFTVTVIWKDEE